MERLTKWNNKLGGYTANQKGTQSIRNHLLGQYENTGLTPEQVQELVEWDTAKPVTDVCGYMSRKYNIKERNINERQGEISERLRNI